MGVRSLVAAAALLAAVLAGCSTARPDPGDTPAAPVPAGLRTGCPDPSTALRFPEGDLPAGATQVRLCPGPPQPHVPAVQAPPELLTRGVDDVVGAVNGLEDLTEGVDCPFDGGPDLAYWFGYPDGDWRAVRLGAHGCRKLHVGVETERLGGIEVAAAFIDALTGQRAATTPPEVPARATCGPFGTTSPSPVPGRPVALATAVLCRSAGAHRYRQAVAPPALLTRINEELLAGPTERPGACRRPSPDWRTVEGYSVWGDRHTYVIDECGRVHPPYGIGLHAAGQEPDATYADPALLATIDGLAYGPVVDTRDE
jgi:hypothetical protein